VFCLKNIFLFEVQQADQVHRVLYKCLQKEEANKSLETSALS